ncbi:MAG: hypothetical protein C5B55_14605 [Blastocatellia bacterium]|nr:MAG: hypothetical protein C5B55_14605 [Blastocatellia bacterium]
MAPNVFLLNRWTVIISFLLLTLGTSASAQNSTIPSDIMLRIVRAEDERRWDNDLSQLLKHQNRAVRERVALAAGRIGNESAIPDLSALLEKDPDNAVRAMAAFAIGETEADAGTGPLIAAINGGGSSPNIRARAIEGLGKIAAALPKEKEPRQRELAAAILEAIKTPNPTREETLLGLTAILRSKPAGAGPVLASFLKNSDARVRADALNTLARLRLKDGNDQLQSLLQDSDPIVRANAARVAGATEDKTTLATLVQAATTDADPRVRVSAIRSLGALKDSSIVEKLVTRAESLTHSDLSNRPAETNELLEIATTFGRTIPATENQAALNWLRQLRNALENTAPEAEMAYARIRPAAYLAEFGEGAITAKNLQRKFILNWRSGAGIAAGLGEIASLTATTTKDVDELKHRAQELLLAMLNYRKSGITINSLVALHTEYGISEVLRAYAVFKPQDLQQILLENLKDSDVIIRATAADLLGDLPPSEVNTRALSEALMPAFNDKLNDAVLSILDSLAKQKTATANETIKSALDAKDYLVRRRAVSLLKQNSVGDFSDRIGTVQTKNKPSDYQRALALIEKNVRAVVTTSKGSFTMEFLPVDAPLTVDNFVQLAQRNYFNGITIHRVVPNFVIQDGDPRGDGNGGPGYEIRCEINEVPFERAAVGMALSGKDTGGSQWFVTHSPQPHLDGGYTVFGRVIDGMDVVDKITRGDVIQSIRITVRPSRG